MAKFCKDIPEAVRIAYKHNPTKLSQPGLFSPTLIYLPIRILAFCSKILEKNPLSSSEILYKWKRNSPSVKTLKGNVYIYRGRCFPFSKWIVFRMHCNLTKWFFGPFVVWNMTAPWWKTMTYLPHLAQLCSQTRRIPDNHAITWIPIIHFSVPPRRPSWKVERSVASSRREIIRNHVFLQ